MFWGWRLLFSCSRRHSGTCSGPCPSLFWQFDKFGTGHTFLLSGICDILYRRGPPTVRNMRAVLKKASWGTRRIFGSIRCKKQASTVRKRYSVPKTVFSGTQRIFKGALNSLLPTECIFESAKNGILSHRTHFQCAKRLRSEVIRHKRRVTSSLSRLFSLIGMEH